MMWIKEAIGIACFILIATPLNGQTLNFLPNLNNATSTQNITTADPKTTPVKFVPLNTEEVQMLTTPSILIANTRKQTIATAVSKAVLTMPIVMSDISIRSYRGFVLLLLLIDCK